MSTSQMSEEDHTNPVAQWCAFLHLFWEGFSFKVNQARKDAFFPNGHWASELISKVTRPVSVENTMVSVIAFFQLQQSKQTHSTTPSNIGNKISIHIFVIHLKRVLKVTY